MASLKALRKPVRSAFTKVYNEIQVELDKGEAADRATIQILFIKLQGQHEKLITADEKVWEELAGSPATVDAELNAEYESVTEYKDKYVDMEYKINVLLNSSRDASAEAAGQSESGDAIQHTVAQNTSKYRLPKLDFEKFSGEPREWLGFWSQFKSIHGDQAMAAEEKFQYLIQATADKSRAREVVKSFPPSAENYPKVIEYLKDRFGKKDVLVKVYVRDLLGLVLNRSTHNISLLYDNLGTRLRALDSLGLGTGDYATMLYPLVESSLPEEVLGRWEWSKVQPGQDTTKNELERLMEYLRTEVDREMVMGMAKSGFGHEESEEKSRPKKRKFDEFIPTAAGLFNGQGQASQKHRICIFCEKGHDSASCYNAGKLTMEERNKIVKEKNACYVCLKIGHRSAKCKSGMRCLSCGKRHSVVMCSELPNQQSQGLASNGTDSSTGENQVTLANHCTTGVMLRTLVVKITSGEKERLVRALIDSGSQRSYITEKVARVLELTPVRETKMAHCLFGGQTTQQKTHNVYEVGVLSKDGKFQCKMQVMDQPKICGSVARVSNGPWMRELEAMGILVSDGGTSQDTPDIHLLIGADFEATLLTGQIYPTESGPVAIETKLGWTVSGEYKYKKQCADSSLLVTTLHVTDADIQDLWKLDVLGISDPVESRTQRELTESATQHFRETVEVNTEGRYEVSLPWIEGHPPVSENLEMAKARLNSATRKIDQANKRQDYQRIFEEWLKLGVIERVDSVGESGHIGCYLPHRPVFKPNSLTTPIRPVFDASAKEKNHPSLNDCLEKGPNLIELIPSILSRFRMKRCGVVSDIKKAFLQISVKKPDRDFLRFLWWNENGGLQVYRHCRVVFGVSSSPFLLAATINHHLDKQPEELQKTCQLLKRSLYVDNCIASLDNEGELKSFIRNSIKVMSSGKFELRGWIWTDAGHVENPNKELEIPVLGLRWNLERDTLALDLRESMGDLGAVVTKRLILSAAHKIFDPIGFSCPVTLIPKILLQEVWKSKLGWDDPVGEDLRKRFLSWRKQLPLLEKLEIPRWALKGPLDENVSLHVFVDASKLAYATCIYLRSESEDDINVQLITAKCRVASTKKITTPRLELMGCCIGARLGSSVKEMIDTPDIETVYWTDSSNCLYWIQNNDNWAAFVWNRVKEIKELSGDNWRHIPGDQNPADLPSRGCSAEKLLESRWWEGPTWLKKNETEWPRSNVQYDLEVIMSEKKKTVVSQVAMQKETPWYVSYFSHYRRLVRMIAWIMCWRKKTGFPIKSEDEVSAELTILKMVQTESFSESDRVINQLNAGLDEFGIWRVRTKILMREDSEDFRLPILLPSDHKLTRLLIQYEHIKMNHCGIQTLLCHLRERFWIIRARKVARQVVSSCGRCRRFSVENVNPIEAPLPINRVRDAAVFEVTGIDLGGPLFLKSKEKAWFVIFTCAVYRAIHIELVTSLSTEAFLQSLRRFIARRGRPLTVYTDNGTNFEGASNALKKLDWTRISDDSSVSPIKWNFNPPGAPWWGGWWEIIVGMVKRLLRRVLGRSSLTYEQLQTVLCDCEQTLNSRPLTYLTDDPDDLIPLTPNLFLQQNRSSGVPDVDYLDAKGLNKRRKHQQQLQEDLRRRFRDEYLSLLVHRNPLKSNLAVLKVGDVVLVASDNKKRLAWPLARVLELFPGRDGVVRVAKLKTANGDLTRPVQRLYPLEVSGDLSPQMKEVGASRAKNDKKKANPFPGILFENLQVPVVTKRGRHVRRPQRYGD